MNRKPNGEGWNDPQNASAYRWVMDDAITTQGIEPKDLEVQYLNNMKLHTTSRRLFSKYKLAYYLGQLRGIRIADEMKDMIAPSEVEPVRRGQWIKHDDDDTIHCHCSACGWESHRYEDDVYGMPRCPKCGAWMEPVEDENWRKDVSGWKL